MEAKLHELINDAKSQSMLFPSSFSIKKRQDHRYNIDDPRQKRECSKRLIRK